MRIYDGMLIVIVNEDTNTRRTIKLYKTVEGRDSKPLFDLAETVVKPMLNVNEHAEFYPHQLGAGDTFNVTNAVVTSGGTYPRTDNLMTYKFNWGMGPMDVIELTEEALRDAHRMSKRMYDREELDSILQRLLTERHLYPNEYEMTCARSRTAWSNPCVYSYMLC